MAGPWTIAVGTTGPSHQLAGLRWQVRFRLATAGLCQWPRKAFTSVANSTGYWNRKPWPASG